MTVFETRILEILQETNMSVKDLCKKANLGKNAIYDLKNYSPTLKTAIKICDTLKISLDYLAEKSDDDSEFIPKTQNINFYNNLTNLLNNKSISKLKFCKDLNLSTDAFTRWKNGAVPYFSTICSIAEYLSIEIEELLGRK